MPTILFRRAKPHLAPRRSDAFTLLELLLVITVIAVLLIMAFAGFGNAQRRSNTVACAADLRAIGVALMGYAHDKGRYPGLRIDATPRFWHHALVPYMTGEPIPRWSYEVSKVPTWLQCRERDRGESGEMSVGYGYNQMFGNVEPSPTGQPGAFDQYWGVRPSQVTAPTQTIVIGDNHDRNADDVGFSTRALHNGDGINNRLRARRHAEGGNYLYADGHVEWISAVGLAERLQVNNKQIFRPYEN